MSYSDFVASSGQPAPTDSSTGVEDLHSRSRRGSGNEAEYDDYDIIDDMEVSFEFQLWVEQDDEHFRSHFLVVASSTYVLCSAGMVKSGRRNAHP